MRNEPNVLMMHYSDAVKVFVQIDDVTEVRVISLSESDRIFEAPLLN